MTGEQTFRLPPDGVRRFGALRDDAAEAICGRFYQTYPTIYSAYGARGRQLCKEDLGFSIDSLLPVFEFGLLEPYVAYLRWLSMVLSARNIPLDHVLLSLDWLGEYYAGKLLEGEAAMVVSALHAARAALLKTSAGTEAKSASGPSPTQSEGCVAFVQSLLSGDHSKATTIFHDLLLQNQGFVETELTLVQPSLYRIGEKWQENQVSVAQEHLATAIVHSILAREFAHTQPVSANGAAVILACVEGNNHAVGLRIVADAFELAGWSVRYLGGNTPTDSLVRMVQDTRPDVVGLSVSLPCHLHAVQEAIARIRAACGEKPAVIVGGLPINQFPPLAKLLGANACASDAKVAVDIATRLLHGE